MNFTITKRDHLKLLDDILKRLNKNDIKVKFRFRFIVKIVILINSYYKDIKIKRYLRKNKLLMNKLKGNNYNNRYRI